MAMHLPTIRFVAAAALVAAALAAPAHPASAATAEIADMDDNLRAKVAKERAKQSARSGGQGGNDSKCGQVDIGNDEPQQRGASQRLNQRDKTVIVTGPVINAAKCR